MHSRISLLVVLVIHVLLCATFHTRRDQYVISQYTTNEIRHIAGLSNVKHVNTVLDNILVPRVVGTQNHTKVYRYLKHQLQQNGFTVEVDEFQDETPIFGTLTFKNIIATLNPHASRFLVLACHYDSKYFPNDEFVGASDSGVPCAMMLNLAKTMQNELQTVKNEEVSLMLLFLDGEEAFEQWTNTDSIYGARNLAKKFAASVRHTGTDPNVSMLDRMDMFILLDLLGPANPTFYSYFRETERHYLVLSRAEEALQKAGLLTNHKRKYFRESARRHGVEDDHLPFMRRGVPILHIIPTPFPEVWHTPADDRSAIDIDTVENLNKIFRVFVAQYLHVQVNNAEGDEMDFRSGFHEEF